MSLKSQPRRAGVSPSGANQLHDTAPKRQIVENRLPRTPASADAVNQKQRLSVRAALNIIHLYFVFIHQEILLTEEKAKLKIKKVSFFSSSE